MPLGHTLIAAAQSVVSVPMPLTSPEIGATLIEVRQRHVTDQFATLYFPSKKH